MNGLGNDGLSSFSALFIIAWSSIMKGKCGFTVLDVSPILA